MNPSNIPLPSSTRASSASSNRERQTGSASRPPSTHTGRAPTGHLGTSKWPTSARSHSRSSTNDPPFLGTKPRVDDRRQDESGPRTGESFMTFTDSSRTDTSSSSASEDPRTVELRTRRSEVSSKDQGTSKSPAEPTLHRSIDSTPSQTLADITVRFEDRPSSRSRREADRRSDSASDPARRLGPSLGDRRPPRVEEDPLDRPTDLETHRKIVPDPPGRPSQPGKTVDHEGRARVVEPPPLPLGRFLQKAPAPTSPREQPAPPSPTEVLRPVPVREETVGRDGEDLQQHRGLHGGIEANRHQETQEIVSSFKSIFCDSFLSPFTNNLAYSLSQISSRVSQIFATLEILKLDCQSSKNFSQDNNHTITSGFLQMDTYFLKLNSHYVSLNEHLESLSQTLLSEIRSSSLIFKEFETKFDKSRIEDKEELLHSILLNSALDAGLDINAVIKAHVSELKKDIQLSLSEQFKDHKKLMK